MRQESFLYRVQLGDFVTGTIENSLITRSLLASMCYFHSTLVEDILTPTTERCEAEARRRAPMPSCHYPTSHEKQYHHDRRDIHPSDFLLSTTLNLLIDIWFVPLFILLLDRRRLPISIHKLIKSIFAQCDSSAKHPPIFASLLHQS